jgi:FAD/FMN-containing dehydrogenase
MHTTKGRLLEMMGSTDGPAADELRGRVSGSVLKPGDEGYDDARTTWNARFDSRPDVIVRCSSDRDMALTVKSGGHDYAGNSAARGGLLVDLSGLKSVEIDPASMQARVAAGVTWGEFDLAAQGHGLATTGGTMSTVGVAGFTLGGGEGWLSRKHGIAADNLIGADVVTADGRVVRASAHENPDLFWGLRGGGGNFGIVTSFEYALHPVGPEVVAGQVIYPADRAQELLRFYRDHFLDAPDELQCFPFLLRIPPVPPFPEAWHGQLALDFVLAYAGPVADGEAALAPFRELGDPILDAVGPQPYLTLQQSFDVGLAKGNRWYSRAHYFDALTDDAIDTLVGHLDPFPGTFTAVYFGAGGGAVGRVDPAATAFPHRGAAHGLHVFPGWVEPAEDDAIMAWARGLHAAMAPYANGSVYVNLLAEDEPARIPAAYGGNYDRLVRLKKTWDPENLFRRNHNIEPGA